MAERSRRSGIRRRTTLAAVAVVGLVLVGAGLAMLTFVERSLVAQVEDAAEVRAGELAQALQGLDGSPPALPDVADPTEEFWQVLRDGVVAASANARGLEAIAEPSPGETVRLDGVPFASGPFVVLAESAGAYTVVVGRSVDDAAEARTAVTKALAVGIPVILAVVGVVTWWIVGRALRPVEEIRAEVGRISDAELHRRVPVPAGEDEIASLAGTMNAMLGRLERARDRQRRFVSDASHELRSPVASIRQHAEVAAAHPADVHVEELARVVLEEDARLERVIDDLLLLTRLDEDAPGRTGEVDLDDVVLAEAARARTTTTVAIDTSGVGPARVLGDEDRLRRMVRNVTENATRHAAGRVSLALARSDGEAVLTVEDDGPGIAEEDRDHVFERFVRLDEGRSRDDGGIGLGLAIVREVARAHGGEVVIEQATTGGARVVLRMPCEG